MTLSRLQAGDSRDRREKALEVERTPALPDLLYAMGLPGLNRSVRDSASVRGGMLSTCDRLSRPFFLHMWQAAMGDAIHPLADDQGMNGPFPVNRRPCSRPACRPTGTLPDRTLRAIFASRRVALVTLPVTIGGRCAGTFVVSTADRAHKSPSLVEVRSPM